MFDFVLQKKKVLVDPSNSNTNSIKVSNDFRIQVKKVEYEKNYEILLKNKEVESLKVEEKENRDVDNKNENGKIKNYIE